MANDAEQGLIIPSEKLQPATLNRLIEEFVTREGTDYGFIEKDLASKCKAVRAQIETGRALVVFDRLSETTHILTREDAVHLFPGEVE